MAPENKALTTISKLPIMQYIPKVEGDTNTALQKVSNKVHDITNWKSWKRGERGMPLVVGMILAIIGLYLGWTYLLVPLYLKVILPFIIGVGKIFTWAIQAVIILILIRSIPLILKMTRRLVRYFHKVFIKFDPFGELEDAKRKMYAEQAQFTESCKSIKKLRSDMEQIAHGTETEAEQASKDVTTYRNRAAKYKDQMDAYVKEHGEQGKETDAYTEIYQHYLNAVEAGKRAGHILDTNKEWTIKYASRANVFAKLDRKLRVGSTMIENKIAAFEDSIRLLKQDYAFGQAANQATSVLTRLLGGKQAWETQYALEVITDHISNDFASSAQNMQDLQRLTAGFDFNSDEAYEELNKLADRIDAGMEAIPEARRISNVNHTLTSDERKATGGLDGIF